MTETEWAAFMARLQELPPMGARPPQSTQDFWREMDAIQNNTGPGGCSTVAGEVTQLHTWVE